MNSPVACCFGLSPELSFSLPSSARRLCLKGCLTPPSTALSGLSPPQCAGHRWATARTAPVSGSASPPCFLCLPSLIAAFSPGLGLDSCLPFFPPSISHPRLSPPHSA